jgi:hypothetical protein
MKVCISCQKDVSGKMAYPVKWDRFLSIILTIKKALHIAQMNELYVCEDCLQKHQERRAAFERSMMLAGVLAGIIILLILSTLILGGRFDAFAFFAGILLAVVMLLFPLFRYAPALEGMPTKPFGKQFSIPFISKPVKVEPSVPAMPVKAEPAKKPSKPRQRKKKEVL